MILDIGQIINYFVTVWIIATFFLESKKYVPYKKVKICVLIGLLLILFLGNFGVGIYLFAQIFIAYILIQILFEGGKGEKVILTITEVMSIANLSMMIESVINIICLILNVEVEQKAINIIIGTSIVLILIAIKYKVKANLGWGSGKIGIRYAFFFMVLVVIESFMVTGMGEFIYREAVITRKLAYEILYILIVLFMFIQIALMIALIISRNVYREKEYLAAKYLEEQKLHYEYLENREKETRKFRHDLKNHLALMNDLLHKKQYETFEAYLQQMNSRIDRFSNKISVNNGIADAIVNKFDIEAEQKGITLHVKGHLPAPCNLSAFDLCTIISNLLSNAIEAEYAAAGNDVYVEFRYTDSEIMLAVENDYKQDLEQENGVFHTTKEDKSNHGFGLENVKECVKRNNGQLTIQTRNHIFKVLVCVENGESIDENSNCR